VAAVGIDEEQALGGFDDELRLGLPFLLRRERGPWVTWREIREADMYGWFAYAYNVTTGEERKSSIDYHSLWRLRDCGLPTPASGGDS
jgi:hypothetical protein